MWNNIGNRLREAPNLKRKEEIIAMIKEGPERRSKELVEGALGEGLKVGSEEEDLAIGNLSERESVERNSTENGTLRTALTYREVTTYDTHNTEMVDAQRTTNNTQWRTHPHLLYILPPFRPYLFHYFSPYVTLELPFYKFLLTLPSATDKYICDASLTYPHIPNLSPMAHIATFDDLQAREHSPIKTGYSLAHDVLTDDILIRRVTWYEPRIVRTTGFTPQRFPPPLVASWAQDDATFPTLLFRGSPARLATLVVVGESLANPSELPRGWDLLLKLVASEWVLLNVDVIKAVRSPEEHRGTFTDDLQRMLLQYINGPLSGMLGTLPFPNTWKTGMLDLTGFNNVLIM